MGELEEIAKQALLRAKKAHDSLGIKGIEEVQKNQFGETALLADIEAEKAVIDTFREAKVPITIVSEEHGIVRLSNNPQFLGVLDGIDGSFQYKEWWNERKGLGRYGTMLGIFEGTDPAYDDYICCGIMESRTGRMFFASKGKGAFVGNTRINAADTKELTKLTRIYYDGYFEINRKAIEHKLKGFKAEYLRASCIYYMDLAEGKADLVVECTRKGNLEPAAAYGLVREAGGVIVDSDGKNIGSQKYFSFGQKEQFLIITAATQELAEDAARILK